MLTHRTFSLLRGALTLGVFAFILIGAQPAKALVSDTPTLTLTLTGCTTCRAGNQFTVQAHVINPSARVVLVEAKAGVRLPDGTTVNLLGNKHLEVSLPASLDTTFTLFDIPSLPPGLPTGTWTFEGTLLGPDLGETFSREVKPFAVFGLGVPVNPFDALYPSSFRLRALSADAIPVVAKPTVKATGLSTPSYIDPVYGTRVYKATDASDFSGASFVRHDYSRRQAFNADNSRFIATSSDGYWLLYDANTFKVLARSGYNGALKGPGGDCEMIWHPSDPKKLWYTGNGGGLLWHEKDVETDTDTVMVDFTGRLPWPQATSVWTKSEGTSSANGRYWAFMATSYDDVTQRNIIYGLFTWDREMNTIIGTYDASNFGGAFPDHISISPSGKYAVPSWAYNPTLGTRAYPLDFSSSIALNPQSEHSDLAIGPDGEDYYVATDYDSGSIRAVNIATGDSFELMPLYPGVGESYAAHISGKAFGKPGWVVISTYADFADYGSTTPAPTLRRMYRKIILVELKPGGRQYNVAHTRAAANYGGYWGEPQATISRDGSRLLFSSNFDDGGLPSDYMIGLPSWVYDY